MPWWLAVAYLPVPIVAQWWISRSAPQDNGDRAAYVATALVIPVLLAFSGTTWRMTAGGRTRWSRLGSTVLWSIAWSLLLCLLLLVPAMLANVTMGSDSAFVDASLMAPLLLLLWPAALAVIGFYVTCIGGAAAMLVAAMHVARTGEASAAGSGPRSTVRWCGGAVLLIGGAVMATGRIIDSLGEHSITAHGRALLRIVIQSWQLRTPGAVTIQVGSVLFAVGIVSLLGARLIPDPHPSAGTL